MKPQLRVGLLRWPHQDRLFEYPTECGGFELDVEVRRSKVPQNEFVSALLEYDVCEIPLVTYAAGKVGLGVTTIPVFPTRRFIQWMVEVPEESEIREPKDLEGKRIVSDYFGNTDSIWARGVLAESYGVDWSETTWMTSKAERFEGGSTPANLGPVATSSIDDLVRSGVADAQFSDGYGGPPEAGLRRLWTDPERAAKEWYESAGYFPILHTIVVKDAVLERNDGLARDLYELFSETKQAALEAYDFGRSLPAELRPLALQTGFPGSTWRGADRSYLDADPLPYGLRENAAVLERLFRFAHLQGATHRHADLKALFADVGE